MTDREKLKEILRLAKCADIAVGQAERQLEDARDVVFHIFAFVADALEEGDKK